MDTDKTEKKQRGVPFAPGHSGNPAGRPKGSRNRATLAVQVMLEGEAEAITRNVIALAKAGDMAAIKLVLERILPPRKDTPLTYSIPAANTAEEVIAALAAVIEGVGQGELTPQQGKDIADLLELQRRSIETASLARKLDTLHAMLDRRG